MTSANICWGRWTYFLYAQTCYTNLANNLSNVCKNSCASFKLLTNLLCPLKLPRAEGKKLFLQIRSSFPGRCSGSRQQRGVWPLSQGEVYAFRLHQLLIFVLPLLLLIIIVFLFPFRKVTHRYHIIVIICVAVFRIRIWLKWIRLRSVFSVQIRIQRGFSGTKKQCKVG